MGFRRVRFTVFALTVIGGIHACSGPEPGLATFKAGTIESASPASSSTSSGGSSSGDAGTGSGSIDPIFGSDTFTYTDPGQTADGHQGTHFGQTPLEGKNCVSSGCHLDKSPQWAFAGTVYAAVGGGATVAQAEVRVVGPDGKEFGRAYTDANGNFWFANASRPPTGSKVGVRKAGSASKAMSTTIDGTSGAQCNAGSCHGSTTLRIYVP